MLLTDARALFSLPSCLVLSSCVKQSIHDGFLFGLRGTPLSNACIVLSAAPDQNN